MSAAPADPRALPDAPIEARRGQEQVALPPPAPGGEDAPLFRIDGRDVGKAALGEFVLRYLPDRASDAVAQLLDEAVVLAEAQREGVTLEHAAVKERVDAWVEDRRREARLQYGASTDFEKLLAERYGRDLAGLRADAERPVRAMLLRDRLVRLDQMREDGVEVRVLVLGTEEAALSAARSLREGADMTLLAERTGARRPASPAPFARGEIPEKDLETRLFAAAAGEVLDPVPFQAPSGGTYWQVFRVTRAWKGSAEPWEAIAPRVIESLRAAPVGEDEARRWRGRAIARHRVEPGPAAPPAAKGSLRGHEGQ